VGQLTRDGVLYFHHGRTLINGLWRLRRGEVGRRVRVSGRPRIVADGRLIVADRVQLYSTLAPLEIVVRAGAHLEIGERTLVNFGTSIVALERVEIGAHCHIGPQCIIMDNAFHEMDPERRLEEPPSDPIVIEDNVWLGARVIVMPGVTIGRDSVVGAGSIVTRDVPPRVFAAGVPATVIRPL